MYTKKGRIVMRLKKVMAITLAAGLTVGSIAIAATSPLSSDSLKGAVSSVAPPAGDPGITGPSGGGSTATTAPTDAPTDQPTDAPTDKPTDAPATSTPKPTATPKPSVKKPAKVSATKKTIKGAKKISGAAGQQIQYSTKKNFSKAVKSKNVTKAAASKQVTLKNVKKGTYYVRVRAYKKSGSKKVYGSWSAKIKVKVTK